MTTPLPNLAHPSGRPLRVLVCDDNRDAADSLAELLSVCGARVEVHYSGSALPAAAAAFAPDVAVLDLWMPWTDGYRAAAELRAWAGYRPLVLVALSGLSDPHSRQAARAAGFDHYHVKFGDPLELLLELAFAAAEPTLALA